MALQPTPMLRTSTVKMGTGSSDRELAGLASDGSTALDTPEVWSPEKEEYEETVVSPVAPTPGRDDYPDGGFTAWSVVLGVSKLNHGVPLPLQIF